MEKEILDIAHECYQEIEEIEKIQTRSSIELTNAQKTEIGETMSLITKAYDSLDNLSESEMIKLKEDLRRKGMILSTIKNAINEDNILDGSYVRTDDNDEGYFEEGITINKKSLIKFVQVGIATWAVVAGLMQVKGCVNKNKDDDKSNTQSIEEVVETPITTPEQAAQEVVETPSPTPMPTSTPTPTPEVKEEIVTPTQDTTEDVEAEEIVEASVDEDLMEIIKPTPANVDFYNKQSVMAYASFLKDEYNIDMSKEEIAEVLYLVNINKFIDSNGDFIKDPSILVFEDFANNVKIFQNAGKLTDIIYDKIIDSNNNKGYYIAASEIERIVNRFSTSEVLESFESAKVNDNMYDVTKVFTIIANNMNNNTSEDYAYIGLELACEIGHDHNLNSSEGIDFSVYAWVNHNIYALARDTAGRHNSIIFGEAYEIDAEGNLVRIDLDGLGGHICAEKIIEALSTFIVEYDGNKVKITKVFNEEQRPTEWIAFMQEMAKLYKKEIENNFGDNTKYGTPEDVQRNR